MPASGNKDETAYSAHGPFRRGVLRRRPACVHALRRAHDGVPVRCSRVLLRAHPVDGGEPARRAIRVAGARRGAASRHGPSRRARSAVRPFHAAARRFSLHRRLRRVARGGRRLAAPLLRARHRLPRGVGRVHRLQLDPCALLAHAHGPRLHPCARLHGGVPLRTRTRAAIPLRREKPASRRHRPRRDMRRLLPRRDDPLPRRRLQSPHAHAQPSGTHVHQRRLLPPFALPLHARHGHRRRRHALLRTLFPRGGVELAPQRHRGLGRGRVRRGASPHRLRARECQHAGAQRRLLVRLPGRAGHAARTGQHAPSSLARLCSRWPSAFTRSRSYRSRPPCRPRRSS